VLIITQGDINECMCERCQHRWITLIIPVTCPKCLTRMWNGAKPRGRPRGPLQPPAKPKRSTRRNRKELPEYSTEW
jgi:hypothetical protein